MMRILIGYDGSESADAVLNDLRRAGLPREAEALIVSVGEASMMPPPSSYELVGTALTSRRVTSAIAHSRRLTAQALEEATGLAAEARGRVRSFFPGWEVRAEGLAGKPSWELIRKADEWNPDLIVGGWRGRSALGLFFLGSVSRNVVTDSHHSVRVVRGTDEKRVDEPPI